MKIAWILAGTINHFLQNRSGNLPLAHKGGRRGGEEKGRGGEGRD